MQVSEWIPVNLEEIQQKNIPEWERKENGLFN